MLNLNYDTPDYDKPDYDQQKNLQTSKGGRIGSNKTSQRIGKKKQENCLNFGIRENAKSQLRHTR